MSATASSSTREQTHNYTSSILRPGCPFLIQVGYRDSGIAISWQRSQGATLRPFSNTLPNTCLRLLRIFSFFHRKKLFLSLTSNPVLASVRSRSYPRLSELYSSSYLPLWHFISDNNNSLKTIHSEELSSSRKCSKCAFIVNR